MATLGESFLTLQRLHAFRVVGRDAGNDLDVTSAMSRIMNSKRVSKSSLRNHNLLVRFRCSILQFGVPLGGFLLLQSELIAHGIKLRLELLAQGVKVTEKRLDRLL